MDDSAVPPVYETSRTCVLAGTVRPVTAASLQGPFTVYNFKVAAVSVLNLVKFNLTCVSVSPGGTVNVGILNKPQYSLLEAFFPKVTTAFVP